MRWGDLLWNACLSCLAIGLLLFGFASFWIVYDLFFPEKNRLRIIDGLLFEGGYFQVSHDLKFYPDPTNQSVRLKIEHPVQSDISWQRYAVNALVTGTPVWVGARPSDDLNRALPTDANVLISLDDCVVIDEDNWRCDSFDYGYGAGLYTGLADEARFLRADDPKHPYATKNIGLKIQGIGVVDGAWVEADLGGLRANTLDLSWYQETWGCEDFCFLKTREQYIQGRLEAEELRDQAHKKMRDQLIEGRQ